MLRLRDIMTTDLLVFTPEVTLLEAMALLTARHVSGAPVVEGATVVGVVSATDLLQFASALPGVPTERPAPDEAWDEAVPVEPVDDGDEPPGTFFHELWSEASGEVRDRVLGAEGPEWNALAEHVVGEVMNPAVCSMAPDTQVEKAAEYMKTAGIHRVLIMENNRLVGLVSTQDIDNAVADHRLTSQKWVFGPARHFDPRGWDGVIRR